MRIHRILFIQSNIEHLASWSFQCLGNLFIILCFNRLFNTFKLSFPKNIFYTIVLNVLQIIAKITALLILKILKQVYNETKYKGVQTLMTSRGARVIKTATSILLLKQNEVFRSEEKNKRRFSFVFSSHSSIFLSALSLCFLF